jgi:two-component system sensor kinase FixL
VTSVPDNQRLAEELQQSEARWRAVIDSAVDGIIVIDAQGRIEAFNPAAQRLFGYSEEEILGQNVRMLMPSPYREEHDQYLARYVTTGQAKIIGIGREVAGRRKDGTTFPLHLSVGEIKMAGERKFTGIVHDLSARVKIEEQLREHAAMARLGEMSAVIAHEVKNPLAGIRGAIQIIGGRLPPGSEDAAIASEIIRRIDSLDMMMKDLLLFARPVRPRWSMVDLSRLLEATTGMLKRDPDLSGVKVVISGSAPAIPGDADMLTIVFQNLLVNSAQALKGKGHVRIAVTTQHEYCRITFEDDGPGIPAELGDKVFTPFFTTKSRGTGLGLPTARRIVEAHGGQISIGNSPAGGAQLTIDLPLER